MSNTFESIFKKKAEFQRLFKEIIEQNDVLVNLYNQLNSLENVYNWNTYNPGYLKAKDLDKTNECITKLSNDYKKTAKKRIELVLELIVKNELYNMIMLKIQKEGIHDGVFEIEHGYLSSRVCYYQPIFIFDHFQISWSDIDNYLKLYSKEMPPICLHFFKFVGIQFIEKGSLFDCENERCMYHVRFKFRIESFDQFERILLKIRFLLRILNQKQLNHKKIVLIKWIVLEMIKNLQIQSFSSSSSFSLIEEEEKRMKNNILLLEEIKDKWGNEKIEKDFIKNSLSRDVYELRRKYFIDKFPYPIDKIRTNIKLIK
jgi:hypothetical protein